MADDRSRPWEVHTKPVHQNRTLTQMLVDRLSPIVTTLLSVGLYWGQTGLLKHRKRLQKYDNKHRYELQHSPLMIRVTMTHNPTGALNQPVVTPGVSMATWWSTQQDSDGLNYTGGPEVTDSLWSKTYSMQACKDTLGRRWNKLQGTMIDWSERGRGGEMRIQLKASDFVREEGLHNLLRGAWEV